MRARAIAGLMLLSLAATPLAFAQDDPLSIALGSSGFRFDPDGGGSCATATVIYNTTHAATLGAEITAAANGPATCMGDKIVLAAGPRSVCEIEVEVFTLAATTPFDLTMELYTDCTSNGAAGSACGTGPGTLIPGTTRTVTGVTPPALGQIFTVVIPYGNQDISSDADSNIVVKLNASRNDVFWRINETPVVGAQPAGEPLPTSVVERCGSTANTNGCARNFGVNNNFSILIRGTDSADLSIVKTDSADPVAVNAAYSYDLAVTNNSATAASTVTVTDTLPAGVGFVSGTGTGWTCGAVGQVVTCTNPSVAGSSTSNITLNVTAPATPGTITNSATVSATTPDPNSANNTEAEDTTIAGLPASVSGTKTVAGTQSPGGTVTYTVVLTNSGTGPQNDNPGDEFTDVLPASLVLVSATASSGTATPDTGTNTVTWNGSIAPNGGTVTITIQATVSPTAQPGTSVSNQGTISFDSDGNNTNDATAVTDDPGVAGAGNPTAFVIAGISFVANVPTTGTLALALAALGLLLIGGLALSRRRTVA